MHMTEILKSTRIKALKCLLSNTPLYYKMSHIKKQIFW